MNYFFLHSVGAEAGGEAVTPEQIRERIRGIVEREDKKQPLSDQRITERLGQMGVHISRRTVAKYRREMGIPGAGGRKLFQ